MLLAQHGDDIFGYYYACNRLLVEIKVLYNFMHC